VAAKYNALVSSISGNVSYVGSGCNIEYIGDLHGKIALAEFDNQCSIATKTVNAQRRGAIGMMVAADSFQIPIYGDETEITIPVYSIPVYKRYIMLTMLNNTYITVTLTSSGTKTPQANFYQWTFTTVRNWDEPFYGNWTLVVVDPDNSHGDNIPATWESYTLSIYGTGNNLTIVTEEEYIPPDKPSSITPLLLFIVIATISLLILGIGGYGVYRLYKSGFLQVVITHINVRRNNKSVEFQLVDEDDVLDGIDSNDNLNS